MPAQTKKSISTRSIHRFMSSQSIYGMQKGQVKSTSSVILQTRLPFPPQPRLHIHLHRKATSRRHTHRSVNMDTLNSRYIINKCLEDIMVRIACIRIRMQQQLLPLRVVRIMVVAIIKAACNPIYHHSLRHQVECLRGT